MKTGLKKQAFTILAFLIPFTVYFFTLAPGVWFIDSGELALAAASLGITHPTGYPLFTIIGRLFTIFFPAGTVYSLNLMCAILISLSLSLLYYTGFTGSIGKLKNEQPAVNIILSIVPVFVLGFSFTVWDFATSLEVYSLQMLFFSVLYFILFKLITSGERINKLILLLSFILGLSFTNHLSTLMIIPSVIFALIAYRDKLNFSPKIIITSTVLFLTGLSAYVYLPVRNSSVLFNWGDPGSISAVYDHISGEQYIRFKESTGILNSFTKLIEKIPAEFTYPAVIIIAAGIIFLFIYDTKLFSFFFLSIVTNVVLASFYKIPDISNYYLLSYITLSIFFGYGLSYIYILVKPFARQIIYVFPLLLLIPLMANFSRLDKSGINILDTYSNNLFSSIGQNGVVLTGKWDYIAAPGLYYQYVENRRPDITILDFKLMRTSWYIKYLIKAKPDMYAGSKQYFDNHLTEALKFEADKENYLNPKTQDYVNRANGYRASFLNLIKNIMETNRGRFYSTYDIPADSNMWIFKEQKIIPRGIVVQYAQSDTLIEFDDIQNINYSLPQYESPYIKAIKDNYIVALLNKSKYLVRHNRSSEAKILLNKALEIDPNYAITKDLLRKLE